MVYYCQETLDNGPWLVTVTLNSLFFFTLAIRLYILHGRKFMASRFSWYAALPEEKQKQVLFNFAKALAELIFLVPSAITVYQGTFQRTLSLFGMTNLMIGSAYFSAIYLNELINRDYASTVAWCHHVGYFGVLGYVYTTLNLGTLDCAYTSSAAWAFFWLTTLTFLDFVLMLYNVGYNMKVVADLLFWVVVFESTTKVLQIIFIGYFNYTYWNEFSTRSKYLIGISNMVWIPADLYLPLAFYALYKRTRQAVEQGKMVKEE